MGRVGGTLQRTRGIPRADQKQRYSHLPLERTRTMGHHRTGPFGCTNLAVTQEEFEYCECLVNFMNKKVFLHERKRYTDRGVSSTPSAALSGGRGYLTWPGAYLPWQGVPTLTGGGGAYLPRLGGYLPWPGGTHLGKGGTYL